jgi:mono/diheme cytochrome c family protein
MKFAPSKSRLLHLGLLFLITFLLTGNLAHAKTQRTPGLLNFFAPVGNFVSTASLREIEQQSEVTPDATRGLELYAQRCAGCHGPEGGGDGELAAGLPNTPTPFNAADYRNTAVPLELFAAITDGRLAQGMPPFGPASSNPIDEGGRWDLVAAIYSLATPPEAVATGQSVYEANCLACHGASGQGNGPEATAQNVPPTDLAGLEYWAGRSNAAVFDRLAPGTIPQHSYSLTEAERWAAVDYARTFSYAYVDPQLLREPIPAGTISGQVVNGTSNQPLGEGEVLLRAFTPEFEEMLSLTTELDNDGRYSFGLSDVPPDWIFLATLLYQGVSFSSGANQLNRAEPALEMPITVYEPVSDAAGITIEQLHLVLEFVEGRLLVNELYRFSNADTAVYVGPTGDPEAGTVEIVLPAGAQNVAFQRSLGGLESFVPAAELVQTETGWVETVPVRPGRGSLNLLVQYELPYQPGETTLAHPLRYPAGETSAVLPATGVTLTGSNWVFQGTQDTERGPYDSYAGAGVAAGEALNLALEGRPRLVFDAAGNRVLSRNQTAELVVGGLALLGVLAGTLVVLRVWQRPAAAPSPDAPDSSALPNPDHSDEAVYRLLQAAADLDEAYERGEMSAEAYNQQRAVIKEQLIARWPRENQ